jgi:2-oxoglutarate ferredoxin oxidoreductase subunit gamma
MSRYELRFSGSGGQGLITAGIIMAKAASIYEGKQAVQSQSYGPEARGGAAKSEVIISGDSIDYPKVTQCDALLALTQKACDRYAAEIKEGGILLVDSDLVKNLPEGNYRKIALPILNIARSDVGRAIVANIVALGAMVAITGVVSRENVEKAVLSSLPEPFLELNRKAFNKGYERARAAYEETTH